MQLDDYQILLDLLIQANELTAAQQFFGRPTALENHLHGFPRGLDRVAHLWMDLILNPAHEVCSDHHPGAKLDPANNVPLKHQLYMLHHHHLVHNELFQYDPETAAEKKHICDLLWDSCLEEINSIKEIYEMSPSKMIHQSELLQNLLCRHAEHLKGHLSHTWNMDEVQQVRKLLINADADYPDICQSSSYNDDRPLSALRRVAHDLITGQQREQRESTPSFTDRLEEAKPPADQAQQEHRYVANVTYCADDLHNIAEQVMKYVCRLHPQSNHNCDQCTLPCPIHKKGSHTWGECILLTGNPCLVHPNACHSQQRCLQPCPLHEGHTWGKCKTLNMGDKMLQITNSDSSMSHSSADSDLTLAADWGGDQANATCIMEPPCIQIHYPHVCSDNCTTDQQLPTPPVYRPGGLKQLQEWVEELRRWETTVKTGMLLPLRRADYQQCFLPGTRESRYFTKKSKKWWKDVQCSDRPFSDYLALEFFLVLPTPSKDGTRPWLSLTMDPCMQTVTEFAEEVYRSARRGWQFMPEKDELVSKFLEGLPPLLHDAKELIRYQPEENDLDLCAEYLQKIWDSRLAVKEGRYHTTHVEGMTHYDEYDECYGHDVMTCLTVHDTQAHFTPLPPEWLLEEDKPVPKCLEENDNVLLTAAADPHREDSREKDSTLNPVEIKPITLEPLRRRLSNRVPIVLLAQFALGVWTVSKGPHYMAPWLASSAALAALWASYDRMTNYFMQHGHWQIFH